ncbi:MAG TPA: T9SS type A sorting domain-containing protein, partial [Cytophaga sp.]|nr:T9SS type A sorting domain-containing protein [Cytophaga sp.]
NGQTFDATLNGTLTNLNTYLPVTVKVENTGSSTLTLTATGGKYITISGTTAASDFTVNETTLTGSIAAGGSQNFTVNLGAAATNGTNRFVSLAINSNDPANGNYVGTIKYSFSGITTTATTNASDIGLSLFPNPSNDGYMHVTTNNVAVNRIVVSNVSGQTEEFVTTEFKTSLKGLLLVRLYTDKGVVSEKIIIQE